MSIPHNTLEENKKLEEYKKQVCDTACKAYQEKLIAGTSGNVSIYIEEQKQMVITPSSYDYALMKPEDIVVIDLDGNIIEGHHAPSSEWKMHAEIYKHVSHVHAIVHTHSPYATSFAVLQKEIPLILIEMIPFIKGSIPVSPYAAQGSPEVGTYAIPYLKERNACLLANHGVVSVGETLDKAYTTSIYVEDVAKIYHMACSIGEPVCIKEEN